MSKERNIRPPQGGTPNGSGALTVLPPEQTGVPAEVAADFDQVRFLCKAAADAGAVMAYAMVLVGVELNRLHKLYGIRAGRPSRGKLTTELSISWPELVLQQAGISDEWARILMGVGDHAMKRIKGIDPKQVLGTPFGLLTDEIRDRVIEGTKNLVDGETIKGLAQQWGIVKPKAKPKGGGDGRTEGSTDHRTPTQVALDTIWPVQNALGTVGGAATFESMMQRLPMHRLEADSKNMANLDDLKEELTKWLSTVNAAIEHHKAHARGKRA